MELFSISLPLSAPIPSYLFLNQLHHFFIQLCHFQKMIWLNLDRSIELWYVRDSAFGKKRFYICYASICFFQVYIALLTPEVVVLLTQIHEYKGKQALRIKQRPIPSPRYRKLQSSRILRPLKGDLLHTRPWSRVPRAGWIGPATTLSLSATP